MLDETETDFVYAKPYLILIQPGNTTRIEILDWELAQLTLDFVYRNSATTHKVRLSHEHIGEDWYEW